MIGIYYRGSILDDLDFVATVCNDWIEYHHDDYGYSKDEILDYISVGYDEDNKLMLQTGDDLEVVKIKPQVARDIINKLGVQYFATEVLGL